MSILLHVHFIQKLEKKIDSKHACQKPTIWPLDPKIGPPVQKLCECEKHGTP